jgi:putative hemolysin
MRVIKTIVSIIAILILFAMLWFLLKFPTGECAKDEDCIPEDPLIGVQYFCDNGVCKAKPFGNPAAQYCTDHNGSSEVRTYPNGSQYGVCVFSDGSECNQWKFFNGECKPGDIFPKTTCQSDNDCVPEFCCHSSTCVSMKYKPNCTGIFCTQECMPGTMDCNQGHCVCVNNSCKVEWTMI